MADKYTLEYEASSERNRRVFYIVKGVVYLNLKEAQEAKEAS
jgi:hypothetical protein